MCPAEAEGLIGRPTGDQPVDEPGREAVATADAVEYVHRARGTHEPLAVEPQHRRPIVPVGRMHLPQRGRHRVDVWELLYHSIHHAEEQVRVKFGPGGHIWA